MFENKPEKNHDNPTIKVVTEQEIEIGGQSPNNLDRQLYPLLSR
jgi:hypothetical protein